MSRNIVEASSLLIQEGYGAERATAPSPNNYEMIEKLGYLISLLSTVAPLQKEPLRLEMMLRRMSDAGGSILRSQQLDGSERPQIWEQSLRLVTDKN